MSRSEEDCGFDLERMFQDPNLMSQPAVVEAKKVWDQWNLTRNRYVAIGLALVIGDYKKMAMLNNVVHDWSLELHKNTHEVRAVIAAQTKVVVEQEACDARLKETMSWLEEA